MMADGFSVFQSNILANVLSDLVTYVCKNRLAPHQIDVINDSIKVSILCVLFES